MSGEEQNTGVGHKVLKYTDKAVVTVGTEETVVKIVTAVTKYQESEITSWYYMYQAALTVLAEEIVVTVVTAVTKCQQSDRRYW